MFILGLQGSPRKNGNTSILLSAFMKEAESLGAQVLTIDVAQKKIQPCKEIKMCEGKGFCPQHDDMEKEIHPLLWQADLIVLATPVFFYNVPAQLKALIDRAQTQWARKNCLKLEDPGRRWRTGFVLAVGATKGEDLFLGINLTAKYFFDAVGATFKGSLTYRRIENIGDITVHPAALAEAREKAKELIIPRLKRKKVLFACRGNACRSQMAQAFTQYYAGDRIEAVSAGDHPAQAVNELMQQVMAERGIDMAFRRPKALSDILNAWVPDELVTMGCEVSCPVVPGIQIVSWNIPDPAGRPIQFMRNICHEIEQKVRDYLMTSDK